MTPLLLWISVNWFSLLQGVGIVAGLFFTGVSLRQATKARKSSDLLELNQQHRELWLELQKQPSLCRILSRDVDLIANPITTAEEEFLNLVIVHYHSGWQLARSGAFVTLKAMQADVRGFFSLPVPKAIWNQTSGFRDPRFVQFVESCLAN